MPRYHGKPRAAISFVALRLALSGFARIGLVRAISVSWDHTLKVWQLETGTCLATLTCDSASQCCAYSDALKLIIAGDAGGHLHSLRLEEPNPTNPKYGSGRVVGNPEVKICARC
jgi:WD40 repeat protein